MEKLSICRICLADNIRMHFIRNTTLQEIYEKLTEKPMDTKDRRPLHVCYMCFARLQKCQQLRMNCLQSEELITKMLDDNLQFVPKPTKDFGKLQVLHPVTHLTIETPENAGVGVNVDEGNAIRKEPIETNKEQEKRADIKGEKNPVQTDGMKKIYRNEGVSIFSVISDQCSDIHTPPITDCHSYLHSKKSQGEAVPKKVQGVTQKSGTQQSDNSGKTGTEGILEQNKNVTRKLQSDNIRRKKVFVNCCKIAIKPYKCYVCGKCFSKQSHLNIHIRVHTGEKPYKVNACEESVTNKSVSDTYMQANDKSYKCDVCEKCFNDKTDLTKHMSVHIDEKPYKCNICDECFSIKCNLDDHVLMHTGGKSYQCDMCSKCFAEKGELNTHIRIHTAEKPFQCDVCQKIFNQKNHLFTHMRTHSGEKPYKCNTCGKCFTNKGGLSIHERIHTNKKLYKCDICEKCFKRNNDLVKHARVHTHEKPYKCDVCDKWFSTQRYLKTHARLHTM